MPGLVGLCGYRLLGGAVAALPDLVGPCRRVTPQDVRFAIAVEVTDSGDFPANGGLAGQQHPGGSIGAVVEVVLAGCAVSPQDVGFAVALEVSDACDLPGLVGLSGDCLHGGAVGAFPDGVGACGDVSPQDVALAVAVKVAGEGFDNRRCYDRRCLVTGHRLCRAVSIGIADHYRHSFADFSLSQCVGGGCRTIDSHTTGAPLVADGAQTIQVR